MMHPDGSVEVSSGHFARADMDRGRHTPRVTELVMHGGLAAIEDITLVFVTYVFKRVKTDAPPAT